MPAPIFVRLPLVAALDRYLDRLESQTGLKANRGMIARRALELFLASHASTEATAREDGESAARAALGRPETFARQLARRRRRGIEAWHA